MATDRKFAIFVCDQMSAAGEIASRAMFGEYSVYCNTKVVALLCDNQLFVKPTAAGRLFIGEPVEKSPFPGAKPHFLIDDGLDDPVWLSKLIAATARELPLPKPKAGKPKAKKAS